MLIRVGLLTLQAVRPADPEIVAIDRQPFDIHLPLDRQVEEVGSRYGVCPSKTRQSRVVSRSIVSVSSDATQRQRPDCLITRQVVTKRLRNLLAQGVMVPEIQHDPLRLRLRGCLRRSHQPLPGAFVLRPECGEGLGRKGAKRCF